MTSFNPINAKCILRERLSSLENDTRRCFWPIENGPRPALFPAVLYAFATIDYLSSCWAGWNDSKHDSGSEKNQTKRMSSFLQRYCKYGHDECQIAVKLWRHLLMHTGEPRLLKNIRTNEIYYWAIDVQGQKHMTLDPIDTTGNVRFQINPLTLVKDLKNGVLGEVGYLEELCQSPDLQQKFLKFFHETETYTVLIHDDW